MLTLKQKDQSENSWKWQQPVKVKAQMTLQAKRCLKHGNILKGNPISGKNKTACYIGLHQKTLTHSHTSVHSSV